MSTKARKIGIYRFIAGSLILAGIPIGVFAKNGPPGNSALDLRLHERPSPTAIIAPQDPAELELASLDATGLSLPLLNLAQLPIDTGGIDAVRTADRLREDGEIAEATRAYLDLIESHLDTPQANGAAGRLQYMADRCDEFGLDAMEDGLPALSDLSSNAAKRFVAHFYFDRASRMSDRNDKRSRAYLGLAMEVSWSILRQDMDDPFKSEIVEKYLVAADGIGQGDAVRQRLSAFADELEPSFTTWLIKTEVNGEEPAMETVPSFDGKVAIRMHFMRTGKAAPDPEEAAERFRKAAAVSRQLLIDQPAERPALYLAAMYLKAAARIGMRDNAVEELEKTIAEQPLSIMRWIVRNELAMDLVQSGRGENETRAGFAHFEIATAEAKAPLIETALNDPGTEVDVRGILVCMLGHAYLGTNRVEEARNYYEWVIENFSRDAHAGDSAEYSIVEVNAREAGREVADIASDFEAFAIRNPASAYSISSLWRAGELFEFAERPEAAREVYQRITREYPASSVAVNAADALGRLQKAVERRGI